MMDWFMFGMVIETGPKFYMVPFPTQKVTDSEFLYKSFVINVLQFQFFCKAFNGFYSVVAWCRALSKILCSTIPIPVHDLKIKVTDFEFFGVKSLQCQLLQSLWLIWVVFGMDGYEILKCFRKEKRVSGELPCPATGLISFITVCRNQTWYSNALTFLCTNICWAHFERLKPLPFRLRIQHLPRGPANVNAQEIMFHSLIPVLQFRRRLRHQLQPKLLYLSVTRQRTSHDGSLIKTSEETRKD